jgi:hypothetical protein
MLYPTAALRLGIMLVGAVFTAQPHPALAEPAIAAGGFIQARASVSSSRVLIGDPIQYRVEVEASEPYQFIGAQPPKELRGFLRETAGMPVEQTPAERKSGRETAPPPRRQWTQTFTLRSIRPGEWEIPPFTVQYRSAEGDAPETLETEPLRVRVDDIEPGSAQGVLQPLTGPERLAYDWTLRNVLITVLGLLCVSAAGYLWWRRSRLERSAPPRPLAPARPPHEEALEALERLAQSPLLSQGRYKEFYTRLADVLRLYIFRRYSEPAMDWTTTELLDVLEQRGRPDSPNRSLLREVLDSCDLVKFARWTPPPETGHEGIEKARRFVKATCPEEPPCAG